MSRGGLTITASAAIVVATVGCNVPAWAAGPAYTNVVNSADPLFADLAIPANAATAGMWLPTQAWPLVGLHASVMPDGRVLSFGTPDGIGVQDGRTLDIWSPALGFTASSHLTIANSQPVDSFCGAAGTLAQTGGVLLSGGGSAGDGYTSYASTLVTPSLSTAVNTNLPLAQQRWYGTMITLADGRLLMGGGGAPYAIVNAYADPAGTAAQIASTPEMFTPGSGWSALTGGTSEDAFGATNNRAWYPRMWVAPDSTVFGISTDKMWSLNPAQNTIQTVGTFKTTVDNTALPNVGPTSTAVMYDVGKILQVGGNGYNNGYASNSSPYATVFDITTPTKPVVKDTAAMIYARQWANSLVLPDGKVLVTGGTTYGDNAGTNAVLAAEIWNPASGTWTVGAPAANYRGYHSATVLLPDGAVLSTGGGVPGPVTNLNAEIYYPPYLFTKTAGGSALAARPQVLAFSNATLGYGGTIALEMASSEKIAGASLIGLSATTHSFNTFQRRIPAKISQSATQVTVTAPSSAAIAPPGYYLLTVLNAAGVPSRGIIVALNAAAVPQSGVTAILPADGSVRSLQLAASPNTVIRHYNFAATSAVITPASDALSRDDASFYTRPGAANAACYSFESKNYPGYFLRHQNFRVYLQKSDASAGFAADSTFCATAGLSGSGFSLQAINYPNNVIHVREAGDVWIDTADGSAAFNNAASFAFSDLSLPVDGNLHALSRLGTPFWMARHANFLGSISSINTASLAPDRADASFYVRTGHSNPACYSFEASNFPGYFLRHYNFRLQLAQSDQSATFNSDSTFCLQPGLAGAGFSLRPDNYPTLYLNMHNDMGLYVDANDNSAAFAGNATFALSPPP